MKEYALEIAKEIKWNAEVGSRAQPNLIDALNASYDYGYTKEAQIEHMRKARLNFVPAQSLDLETPSQVPA